MKTAKSIDSSRLPTLRSASIRSGSGQSTGSPVDNDSKGSAASDDSQRSEGSLRRTVDAGGVRNSFPILLACFGFGFFFYGLFIIQVFRYVGNSEEIKLHFQIEQCGADLPDERMDLWPKLIAVSELNYKTSNGSETTPLYVTITDTGWSGFFWWSHSWSSPVPIVNEDMKNILQYVNWSPRTAFRMFGSNHLSSSLSWQHNDTRALSSVHVAVHDYKRLNVTVGRGMTETQVWLTKSKLLFGENITKLHSVSELDDSHNWFLLVGGDEVGRKRWLIVSNDTSQSKGPIWQQESSFVAFRRQLTDDLSLLFSSVGESIHFVNYDAQQRIGENFQETRSIWPHMANMDFLGCPVHPCVHSRPNAVTEFHSRLTYNQLSVQWISGRWYWSLNSEDLAKGPVRLSRGEAQHLDYDHTYVGSAFSVKGLITIYKGVRQTELVSDQLYDEWTSLDELYLEDEDAGSQSVSIRGPATYFPEAMLFLDSTQVEQPGQEGTNETYMGTVMIWDTTYHVLQQYDVHGNKSGFTYTDYQIQLYRHWTENFLDGRSRFPARIDAAWSPHLISAGNRSEVYLFFGNYYLVINNASDLIYSVDNSTEMPVSGLYNIMDPTGPLAQRWIEPCPADYQTGYGTMEEIIAEQNRHWKPISLEAACRDENQIPILGICAIEVPKDLPSPRNSGTGGKRPVLHPTRASDDSHSSPFAKLILFIVFMCFILIFLAILSLLITLTLNTRTRKTNNN